MYTKKDKSKYLFYYNSEIAHTIPRTANNATDVHNHKKNINQLINNVSELLTMFQEHGLVRMYVC
jgi:hypothetical protein